MSKKERKQINPGGGSRPRNKRKTRPPGLGHTAPTYRNESNRPLGGPRNDA